jgi:hypothetical protein
MTAEERVYLRHQRDLATRRRIAEEALASAEVRRRSQPRSPSGKPPRLSAPTGTGS